MDYYSVPRRILRGARQLVYPRRCPFCDRVLGSVPICPDCAAELEELRRKPGMRLDASQHYLGKLTGAEPVPELVEGMSLGYDCIVPVPASGRARGYNVPQLMAVPLARALGIPLYPKALGRTRAKRHQAGLPFEQRLANVAGAFRVTDTELVEGRKVLLVDDVITTGATAAACTQALLAAGAESVFAIALATVEFEMFPARDQPLQENEPEF